MKMMCFFAAIALIASTGMSYAQEEARQAPVANSRYYAELAQIHTRYRMYGEAEECLKRAIELETDLAASSHHAYQLGRVYLAWGKPEAAKDIFEYALEATPDAPTRINRGRELAELYFQTEQHDLAEELYRRLIAEADPVIRGQVQQEFFAFMQNAGRLDAVIAQHQAEATEQPTDVAAINNLAQLYKLTNQRDKEIELYEKWAKLEPNAQRPLFLLANAYRTAKRTEDAIAIFTRLIDVNPQATPFYIAEIIKLHASEDRKKEVRQWGERLVGKDTPTAAGHSQLAQIYTELGWHEDALTEHENAVKLAGEPRQREYYQLQLAQAYFKAGRLDDAETLCTSIIETSLHNSSLQQARELLNHVQKGTGTKR